LCCSSGRAHAFDKKAHPPQPPSVTTGPSGDRLRLHGVQQRIQGVPHLRPSGYAGTQAQPHGHTDRHTLCLFQRHSHSHGHTTSQPHSRRLAALAPQGRPPPCSHRQHKGDTVRSAG
jgi:hypothetical protein